MTMQNFGTMSSTKNVRKKVAEISMQIFVDADACPVVDIIEKISKKYHISVTLLCDTNHVLHSDYSEVIVVGAGADAVDYKLISICHKGDVVVSQDYGVAAMALGKGAYAIHQSGKWYTDDNIDQTDGVSLFTERAKSFIQFVVPDKPVSITLFAPTSA